LMNETEGRAFMTSTREQLGDEAPWVQRDAQGALQSTEHELPEHATALKRIVILVQDPQRERVTRTEIPFWFFAMKAPATQFLLRNTPLDLENLGITPAALRAHGPGLVYEQIGAGRESILIWTE
jgi:hypothetical protein